MRKFLYLILMIGIVFIVFNFTNVKDSEADSSSFINTLQDVKIYEETNFISGRYNEVYFTKSEQTNQNYLNLFFIWEKTKNKEEAIEDFKSLANRLIAETDLFLTEQDIEQLLFNTLRFNEVVNEGHYKTTIRNNEYELINKGYHLSLIIRVKK